jgi:DNA repair exonuclease SbcCD ATPase subunit
MKDKNIIAHLSDIHIRYGSRHEEYKVVFQRTIDDLKILKPRRIAITGDVFHIKITLSPKAIQLAGWFLKELSKIAPVDIILGNHDLNLQSLEQGNSIEPIIDLISDGYLVEKNSKQMPEHKGNGNGVFFFLNSGFYQVDEEIVYGVYSCLDNEILTLSKKEKNKKYIALYHGPVYGCRGDNGYELKGDNLMNLSSFNNFDIVMLGDIHEQQSFSTKNSTTENVAYPGSLIQQGYGESLDKGYIFWDLENNSFKRKIISNDYGFSKLYISRGELMEERVEDLKLSNDPKKTKVEIVWECYEEEYSVEKERQIEKLIKNKYGCQSITVDSKFISKTEEINGLSIDESIDYSNTDEFETLLREFVENSEYENVEEVVELSKNIDEELNYKSVKGKKWYLDKLVVWNLFSFPDNKTTFDFTKMSGVTGIFGKNFNGKTNLIRAFIWIAYRKILGDGDANRLVNMYTGNDTAGGRIYLTIDSQKYYIERTVKVKLKKDGTHDVSYGVEYKKEIKKEDGTLGWENVDSEKAATEKKERSNIIVESIGTFEDFTKTVLQAQGGEGNFLDMSQQPKNDLINKYLGLEMFRDRYEYAKKIFNDIKSRQKVLGNPKDIEENIEKEKAIIQENIQLTKDYNLEKESVEKETEINENKILELTKDLIKIEKTAYNNVGDAEKFIYSLEKKATDTKSEIDTLQDWVSKNFKKELPDNNNMSSYQIEENLNKERNLFEVNKSEYVSVEKWIKENPKQLEEDVELINKKINEIDSALSVLNDKLLISKGKKCPTCGNIEQDANPDLEEKCSIDIKRGEEALNIQKQLLVKAKNSQIHNNNYDKNEVKLGSLKNVLQEKKMAIEQLKKDLETSKNIQEIKNHNSTVENNNLKLESNRKKLVSYENEIEEIKKEIKIMESNKSSILNNEKINEEIKVYDFEKKSLKLRISQLNDKITESKSAIKVSENNIENFEDKLSSIKSAEEAYGKYAIYLQAVHRDGIPARIIKKKLPIINQKINNILKDLVDFKIELIIKPNGDIKELFYFNSLEKDALPMSMGSGAQKFIGSVAIRDSLHFVSSLTKPSLCIIDEGFGSLDDDLAMAMNSVFAYLKNKYRNTWIITHKNEIKDFVDNIIQVSKSKKGLTDEQLNENPNAGVSVFDIQI